MTKLDALDDPIWNALATEQASLAQTDGDAARFPPDVTALAGVRAPTTAAFDALARLLAGGARAGLFLDRAALVPRALAIVDGAPLVQMIQPSPPRTAGEGEIETLGPRDVAEMMALAEVTRPGPFGPRTIELGTFLAVRAGGRLAAMAGQRMRLPGLVEVSAVCTHPEHVGRGYGARLMDAQCALVHAAGALPFLHVRADNARAIALYARLGFVERRRFDYCVVRAAA